MVREFSEEIFEGENFSIGKIKFDDTLVSDGNSRVPDSVPLSDLEKNLVGNGERLTQRGFELGSLLDERIDFLLEVGQHGVYLLGSLKFIFLQGECREMTTSS